MAVSLHAFHGVGDDSRGGWIQRRSNSFIKRHGKARRFGAMMTSFFGGGIYMIYTSWVGWGFGEGNDDTTD
jgi:hypothetical protein